MAERFSNLDLLKLGSPTGDKNRPLVVPAVGLGYATPVLRELLALKAVDVIEVAVPARVAFNA